MANNQKEVGESESEKDNKKTVIDNRAKSVRAQITILSAEANSLRSRGTNLYKEAQNKMSYVKQLQQELRVLNGGCKFTISEHAILRYLERVKGLDIGEIQREILTPSITNMIETLGESGTYPGKGYRVIVKDGVIVTVI